MGLPKLIKIVLLARFIKLMSGLRTALELWQGISRATKGAANHAQAWS